VTVVMVTSIEVKVCLELEVYVGAIMTMSKVSLGVSDVVGIELGSSLDLGH
jgi:hypothetical protein